MLSFSGFWGSNRFADPSHKSIKFRGIPWKPENGWNRDRKSRYNDMDIDDILTKVPSPTQTATARTITKKGGVECWPCVCVRVHGVGRQDSRETALCSKLLL